MSYVSDILSKTEDWTLELSPTSTHGILVDGGTILCSISSTLAVLVGYTLASRPGVQCCSTTGSICWCARGVKGQVGGSIPTGNNPPNMNGRRRVRGWGALGCSNLTWSGHHPVWMDGEGCVRQGCYTILCSISSTLAVLVGCTLGCKLGPIFVLSFAFGLEFILVWALASTFCLTT